MTYWTWSGKDGELPTEHYFEYGLFNIWDDGLTIENHWLDADQPTLKPEVLADIEAWGGKWHNDWLQIIFPTEEGAMMWKLKYASKTRCTSS